VLASFACIDYLSVMRDRGFLPMYTLIPTHSKPPEPHKDERPTEFAERIGRWYASLVPAEHKKRFGQYFTTVEVADFMASLCQAKHEMIRILDSGAGAGVLACALAEHLASLRDRPSKLVIVAYETDATLFAVLEKSLSFLQCQLKKHGVAVIFAIRNEDFIMKNAEALDESLKLFPDQTEDFDIVICNPPYFKLSKSDPRAKAADAVVHGQPNIYALFMAVAAYMLAPDGDFIFITPRSFASGPYFRLFRERFFAKMRPERIHTFISRTEAFDRDDILQENMIMKARRLDGWLSKLKDTPILISSSNGASDLSTIKPRKVPLESVFDVASFDKVLRIPVSEEEEEIVRFIHAWPGSLKSYGLEISTGPIVPFRTVPLLSQTGEVPETHAPLLWMQHVRAMKIEWPISMRQKEQYIKVTNEAMPLLVADKNYVLLRRFSAKEERRRLTAAPLIAGYLGSPRIGLENHLNYVHRPGGTLTVDEAWGLAALYNSSFLDTYFRVVNGNTQVSATELRAMPLPSLKVIVEIGRRARASSNPIAEIEWLVLPAFEGIQHNSEKMASYG
jgi:adenine-specific DNA-methyltransferase